MKPWRGVCPGQWQREGKTGSGQGNLSRFHQEGKKNLDKNGGISARILNGIRYSPVARDP